MSVRIIQGDCREVMATLPDASVDAIVTDPPYELGFMGKGWDRSGIANDVRVWREALRVLKPGGHVLAFGGTRTYHRMVCAIEDAGFEVRDQIGWLYGSGFPKSLDVSKAIDKAAGAEREVVGARQWTNAKMEAGQGISGLRQAGGHGGDYEGARVAVPVTAPATDAARQWQGWGTALKPAWEPIVLARKPLAGTVAANVLAHGTGALNIDACRVPMSADDREFIVKTARPNSAGQQHVGDVMNRPAAPTVNVHDEGRWPANVIHDGSDEVVAAFPQGSFNKAGVFASGQAAGWAGGNNNIGRTGDATRDVFGYGDTGSAARFFYTAKPTRYDDDGERGRRPGGFGNVGADKGSSVPNGPTYLDGGSAARFFYTAKATRYDRNDGLDALDGRVTDDGRKVPADNAYQRGKTMRKNHHPTVKPTDLMRYLCRLVTPPGGMVLDPFMGSGSTLKAAELEGFSAIGIELDPEYIAIARNRIASDAPLFRDEVFT